MLYALPAVTTNPHFLRPVRNLVRLLVLMFLRALVPYVHYVSLCHYVPGALGLPRCIGFQHLF